jgi:hypothetical protein
MLHAFLVTKVINAIDRLLIAVIHRIHEATFE